MNLHADWRKILRKAWSIRFNLLAGFCDGCILVIPFIASAEFSADYLPYLAIAGMLSSIGSVVARILSQKEFRNG